jgi:hypothetical protein
MSFEEILAGEFPEGSDSQYGSFSRKSTATVFGRWTRHFDETYQAYYYVNNDNNVSQWEVPVDFMDYEERMYEMNDPIVEQGPFDVEYDFFRKKSVSIGNGYVSEEDKDVKTDMDKFVQNDEYYSAYEDGADAKIDEERDKNGKAHDYLAMAQLYKQERPYCDPSNNPLCLLCHSNPSTDVFFPCQHKCVCRDCIMNENICDEYALSENPRGYNLCSLCANSIKLILPGEGGKEEEKYWNWVYAERVELPREFMKRFRHSAAVIQVVYVDENRNRKMGKPASESSMCLVS